MSVRLRVPAFHLVLYVGQWLDRLLVDTMCIRILATEPDFVEPESLAKVKRKQEMLAIQRAGGGGGDDEMEVEGLVEEEDDDEADGEEDGDEEDEEDEEDAILDKDSTLEIGNSGGVSYLKLQHSHSGISM